VERRRRATQLGFESGSKNMKKWIWPLVGIVIMMGIGLLWGDVSLLDIPDPLRQSILWDIRLPRLVTAAVVGGSLALAGAAFQGMLQNPLADPYVLGVSSGSAFGACLGLLWGAESQWGIVGFSSVGALCTILAVLALTQKQKHHITHFILAGMMINAFFSALNLVLLVGAQSQFRGMMMWLMGDLGHTSLSMAILMGGIAIGLAVLLMRVSPQINLIALGDDTAQTLGVSVKKVRVWIFVCASLLTGLAVACGGVIGFVGLVIPHCIRWIRGDNFSVILPLSALWGSLFLMTTDWLSHSLVTAFEIPIGAITALIGVPFFLILFLRESHGSK
jgi:iron complex transport system permease protein